MKVQLADCLVVAQWHHVNPAGDLVLTPEHDVIEQLAAHLVEQITAELL